MSIELEIRDFNIGQGGFTAIKILNRAGKKLFSILYDCGSSSSKKKVSQDYIFSEFKKFNIDKTIDILVITHLDADHVNWVPALLSEDNFNAKKILVPYISPEIELLFLHSIKKSKNYQPIHTLTNNFLKPNINNDQLTIYRSIEEGNPNNITTLEPKNEKLDDETTIVFNTAEVKINEHTKTVVLKDISLKYSQRECLQVFFIQPNYNIEKFAILNQQAKSHIEKFGNLFPKAIKEEIGSLKKKYKEIHRDLNTTCIGMIIIDRTCCLKESKNEFHIHVYTSDLTINDSVIEKFCRKLFDKKFFIHDCLCFFPNRKNTFSCVRLQLPHHGSSLAPITSWRLLASNLI
jgi:hypothetical protein